MRINYICVIVCVYKIIIKISNHFFGIFKRGGGLRGIKNKARIGCILHNANRREKERDRYMLYK